MSYLKLGEIGNTAKEIAAAQSPHGHIIDPAKHRANPRRVDDPPYYIDSCGIHGRKIVDARTGVALQPMDLKAVCELLNATFADGVKVKTTAT